MGRNENVHALTIQNFPFDAVDVERAQIQKTLAVLRPNLDMIALHGAPAETAHEVPKEGFHGVLERRFTPMREKANATAFDRELLKTRESVEPVRSEAFFYEERDVFLMTKDRRSRARGPFDDEREFGLLNSVREQHERC